VVSLLTPGDTDALEKLITTKSWWDAVDVIDAYVGDLCLRYPELKETVISKWMVSQNIWLKRVSIDFQLRFKDKTDTNILSRAILTNTGTREFFVNKAIGWSLREYSKINPDWVRLFIDTHRDRLSALSIKEGSKYL
jgi:3-methyladenine DNA glycosylase AlkD